MKKLDILSILCILSAITSCELEEGKGGRGEISGQVMVQVKYSNPILGIKDSIVKEYPAVDQKVFLSYGENTIYDDDFDTDENGRFKFDELTKGKYTLTVHSYCNTCDTQVEALHQDITLDSHKSKAVATTFNIAPEN